MLHIYRVWVKVATDYDADIFVPIFDLNRNTIKKEIGTLAMFVNHVSAQSNYYIWLPTLKRGEKLEQALDCIPKI